MIKLHPDNTPIYIRQKSRVKIENIRRNTEPLRFSYQVTLLGSIFLLISIGTICYYIAKWYK